VRKIRNFVAKARYGVQRFLRLMLRRWVVVPEPERTRWAFPKFQSGEETSGAVWRQQAWRPVRSVQRERLIHFVLGLSAVVIVARLVHIQIFCGEEFSARALRQQVSEEPVLARPGDLFDRHGRLLATTILVPSLFVCPARIDNIPVVSQQLATVLKLDAETLQQRLERNSGKQFLWVKRRLTDEELVAVQKLHLPGKIVGFRREFQRLYPQGSLACHVLGIRNIDGIGQGGVEESLQGILNGRDGVRKFVRDARGYVLNVLDEVTQPPVDGSSVVLTIDALLQFHVERQLDLLMQKHRALGACAIVIDPRRGEVLALANRPAFDPNQPELAAADAWKNMAISSVFEPGSTFKPMVVAWAVDRGVIARDATYDCEQGAYRMGRRMLHDHHPYGELSVTDVLVKSSNIGMAKIGEQLGNAKLFELTTDFGFGRRTGIELPGELSGLLRPLEKWNSYSTGSIPMGQELAATPLQMIAAHAALANQGVRISPHLVLSIRNEEPLARKSVVTRIIGQEAANWVMQGPLLEAVARGTGQQAQQSGLEIFGKTGTAQKLSTEGSGYSATRHFSSFIGGANASNPQLIVLVSVDEPQGADQYGGSVAAPYVAAILKQGMAIVGHDPEHARAERMRE